MFRDKNNTRTQSYKNTISSNISHKSKNTDENLRSSTGFKTNAIQPQNEEKLFKIRNNKPKIYMNKIGSKSISNMKQIL